MKRDNIDLTIAIPVYNVEKYLVRCLESIINQKYENKEILLVNDGSTDGSLDICLSFQNRFPFIRVINQENRGLAEVRNICVREAKGKYISFIDSDDYLLPGVYEKYMPVILKEDIDIFCYGVKNFYGDTGAVFEDTSCENKYEMRYFTKDEALDDYFLPNYIDVITCNKIIKKTLYNGIEYPIGKLYEDMFTNYKVIANSDRILATTEKYYAYCHRESSIGGMKYSQKTMGLVDAASEAYEYIKSTSKINVNTDVGYITWLIVVANIMIRSNYSDPKYFKKLKNIIYKNLYKMLINERIGYVRKIEYCLFAFNTRLYKYAYLKYLKANR